MHQTMIPPLLFIYHVIALLTLYPFFDSVFPSSWSLFLCFTLGLQTLLSQDSCGLIRNCMTCRQTPSRRNFANHCMLQKCILSIFLLTQLFKAEKLFQKKNILKSLCILRPLCYCFPRIQCGTSLGPFSLILSFEEALYERRSNVCHVFQLFGRLLPTNCVGSMAVNPGYFAFLPFYIFLYLHYVWIIMNISPPCLLAVFVHTISRLRRKHSWKVLFFGYPFCPLTFVRVFSLNPLLCFPLYILCCF